MPTAPNTVSGVGTDSNDRQRWRFLPAATPISSNPAKEATIFATIQLIFVLGLIGAISAGFAVALQRLPKDGSAPAILVVLFVLAILLLVYSLWRSVARLARLLLYGHATESVVYPDALPPSRLTQLLFGPPPGPKPLSEQNLPDYESALKQAARQQARRRAREMGVSAGRRGREYYATGDAEDLEIVRLERMGEALPMYRSDEMRKSTVLLKGAKPPRERRLSRMSLFSNTTAADSDVAPSPRRSSTPSRITSLLHSISDRFSLGSGPSPTTPRTTSANALVDKKNVEEAEKGDSFLAETIRLPESAAKKAPTRSRFYGQRSSSLLMLHLTPVLPTTPIHSHSYPSLATAHQEQSLVEDAFEMALKNQHCSDRMGEGIV